MASSVVLADLHINTTKHPKFELNRVNRLIDGILAVNTKITHVILAGDIFDRNTPSLRDIQLFYYLVDKLQQFTIEVINGNHDFSAFEFLPQAGFTYYNDITYRDNFVFIPWSKLDMLPEVSEDKTIGCISHARCTIPPHIVEEVPIIQFAEKFHTTILGDIHSPMSPYPNVHYCSSPHTTHYKPFKAYTHGFILVDNESLEIHRKWLPGPSKIKLVTDMDNLSTVVAQCTNEDNLYKIVVEDYAERLKGINKKPKANVIVEPLVKVQTSKVSSRVQELLSQSKTIEDIVFQYVEENYLSYDSNVALEIRNKIKGN